jgi:DNA-directed RNA polymerase sigma subunit (sigma70/sigma32)
LEQVKDDDIDNLGYSNDSDSDLVPPTIDPTDYEIEDSLELLTQNEREVVLKRLDGYTDDEIAKDLNFSRERIRQLRESIKHKFRKIWWE